MPPPLTINTYPRAILHIDGDAFFASCEQARDPKLQGRPVITGKERGIASSMSYEAKSRGITRGMRLRDIKKACPDAILLASDYETYSLLSKRLFSIVRRYTPDVEEYSIDECFADITGLRRIYHTSYEKIALSIKKDLDTDLGFTFSAGLAPSKVIAKVGSKWKKPSGFTAIPGRDIHLYLAKLPTEKIWGIGGQTAAFLKKYHIHTALDFAQKDEDWVKGNLTKPFYEIWQELNGRFVYELELQEKTSYASIQKVKTFTPPSNNKTFVFSQLMKNIENACMKARRYNLYSKEVVIFLKTQQFQSSGTQIKLSRPSSFPHEIGRVARQAFEKIFSSKQEYRSTGILLLKLEADEQSQMDLFGSHLHIEKMRHLYAAVDKLRNKHGKHTVYLGPSHWANNTTQHESERGDSAERKIKLLPGESKRRRLGIPMFLGNVS